MEMKMKKLGIILFIYVIYVCSMYIYCLPESEGKIVDIFITSIMMIPFSLFIRIQFYYLAKIQKESISDILSFILLYIFSIPMLIAAVLVAISMFYNKRFENISVIFGCIIVLYNSYQGKKNYKKRVQNKINTI